MINWLVAANELFSSAFMVLPPITFFGFSLITAAALGLISRDYEFVPGSQESERSNNQTGQIEIPGEVISKFLRTSGNLDPGNVEVQVLFLNPIQNIEQELKIESSSGT